MTCEACWGRWWKDSMSVWIIGLITYNVPIHQLNYVYISSTQYFSNAGNPHTPYPIFPSTTAPSPQITAQPARWPCCQSPEASSHLGVPEDWRRLRYAAVRTSHLEKWGDGRAWAPSWGYHRAKSVHFSDRSIFLKKKSQAHAYHLCEKPDPL